MSFQKSNEVSRNLTENRCPECGEINKAQVKNYLLECDRCLSKRDE